MTRASGRSWSAARRPWRPNGRCAPWSSCPRRSACCGGSSSSRRSRSSSWPTWGTRCRRLSGRAWGPSWRRPRPLTGEGGTETRAWTISRGATALRAGGTIHSDIEKGFIKAEVVGFEDLREAGGTAAARKRGTYRLEGKDYVMQDGDVIVLRFNV